MYTDTKGIPPWLILVVILLSASELLNSSELTLDKQAISHSLLKVNS